MEAGYRTATNFSAEPKRQPSEGVFSCLGSANAAALTRTLWNHSASRIDKYGACLIQQENRGEWQFRMDGVCNGWFARPFRRGAALRDHGTHVRSPPAHGGGLRNW
jgi:hypothetical protein